MDATGFGVILMLCLIALLLWGVIAGNEEKKKAQERQQSCPHLPEWQETMRVSRTRFFIDGQRWLVKHCRGCGKQVPHYAPTLQPWDQYKSEFDQETRDRAIEYRTRLARHEHEREWQRKKEEWKNSRKK